MYTLAVSRAGQISQGRTVVNAMWEAKRWVKHYGSIPKGKSVLKRPIKLTMMNQLRAKFHTLKSRHTLNGLFICIVSNAYRSPPSCPGLDQINGSVQFLNHPKTQPAISLLGKRVPEPIDPQVMQGLASSVGSNLQFSFSGFSIPGHILISYC